MENHNRERLWIAELIAFFFLAGFIVLQFLLPLDLSWVEWLKRALFIFSMIVVVVFISTRIAPTRELFHNTKKIEGLTDALRELNNEMKQLREEKFPSLVKVDEMMESEALVKEEVWVFSRSLKLDLKEKALKIIYGNLLAGREYHYFLPDDTEKVGAEKELSSLKKKLSVRAGQEREEIDLSKVSAYHVHRHCFLSTVIIHDPNQDDARFFIKMPSDLPEQSYRYVFEIRREDTRERELIIDCLKDFMHEECKELKKNKKKKEGD